MDVRDLIREQIAELKGNYLIELANEGTYSEIIGVDWDAPSYGEMADADEIVPDNVIFEHYDGYSFSNDDFFCTAGHNSDEPVIERNLNVSIKLYADKSYNVTILEPESSDNYTTYFNPNIDPISVEPKIWNNIGNELESWKDLMVDEVFV